MNNYESLRRELESATHTLIDLKTVMRCVSLTMERTEKTLQSITPRIKKLEERIDRLTIEIGENDGNNTSMDTGS